MFIKKDFIVKLIEALNTNEGLVATTRQVLFLKCFRRTKKSFSSITY